VVTAIRRTIAEKHQLQVHAVALIKQGSILKTSSGKIQRHACRNAFLAGTLNLVGDGKPVQSETDLAVTSQSQLFGKDNEG
jgi:acyl-CoA synthetase (AMP-forming)/AMP-acid ligase II